MKKHSIVSVLPIGVLNRSCGQGLTLAEVRYWNIATPPPIRCNGTALEGSMQTRPRMQFRELVFGFIPLRKTRPRIQNALAVTSVI